MSKKEIQTPENWSWKITSEDIERIKGHDVERLNAVFMANYDRIRAMAGAYCRNHYKMEFVDDCVNQVYVEFASYGFETNGSMFWDVRHSFFRACLYSKCRSLDEPLKGRKDDEGARLGELIPDPNPTSEEQAEMRETKEESAPRIFNIILEIAEREQANGAFSEEKIRSLVEYVFPTYYYEEIKEMAGC